MAMQKAPKHDERRIAGRFPIDLLEKVVELGGLPVAVQFSTASRSIGAMARRIQKKSMPADLADVLRGVFVTVHALAEALALPQHFVEDENPLVINCPGGVRLRMLTTTDTIQRLLIRHGGLWTLLKRIEKRDARRLRNPKFVDNGAPRASLLGSWIKSGDAGIYGMTPTQEAALTRVPRPGSRASRPNIGYWKKECQNTQINALLLYCGVDRKKMRIHPSLKDYLVKLGCFRSSRPLSRDEMNVTLALADFWHAAKLMTRCLPSAIAAKHSILRTFVAILPTSLRSYRGGDSDRRFLCENTLVSSATFARYAHLPSILKSPPAGYSSDTLASDMLKLGGLPIVAKLLSVKRRVRKGLKTAVTKHFRLLASCLNNADNRSFNEALPHSWKYRERYEQMQEENRQRKLLRTCQ